NNTDAKIATLRALTKSFPNSAYVDDALYSIGESYMNAGNFSQAAKEFQSLNYNYPKNRYFIAAQLSIGMAYLNMLQDDKAVQIFKSIVQKYPASPEAKQALSS